MSLSFAYIYRQFSKAKADHGRRAAWEWIADRLGVRLINLGVSELVWLSLDKIQLAGDPPAGFEFRFLTPSDIAGFLSPTNELDERHVTRAERGHDLCFAALSGDRLAGFGWYALGSIEGEHCDGVNLSFPDDVSYMYKGFTHPDFRGQRLHGYAMRLALEALAAERGIEHLVSTVSWTNWPSLKSCDRLGYERLGRIVTYGWDPLSIELYPRAAKARGVRFGRDADLSNRETPVAHAAESCLLSTSEDLETCALGSGEARIP
jgi:RimJ/RimL family protein N-acetyltransferase